MFVRSTRLLYFACVFWPAKIAKLFPAGLLVVLYLSVIAARAQSWSVQTSGTDTNLRAVSAAYSADPKGEPIVWASGSNGFILRSVDAGKTWKRIRVEGGDALDFRALVAFDANQAYVLSIGNGGKSRIYKTSDGGATWKLQYRGRRNEVFLDGLACISEKRCWALGDPVDGKFLILATEDGEHWKQPSRQSMTSALPGEGAFAASNSSLIIDNDHLYFGTGGARVARVFRSADWGDTWSVVETPIASGNASSGIFSLNHQFSNVMFTVGGDYRQPDRSYRAAAVSRDGGKTWQLAAEPGGFRSAVAAVDSVTAVAVGPGGEDITSDQGQHWTQTDSLNLNAVVILDIHNGWAVGPHGTVARFVNHKQYQIRVRHGAPNGGTRETRP